MYGEYSHVLEKVIGCRVERLALLRHDGYTVNLDELAWRTKQGYDLIVLVNPNNPTGRHIRRSDLESLLSAVPPQTRMWIDEAYIDYVGASESLERFAAESENIIVCKTMSKVYALSGMRVAYLCASPHQLSDLISITPPWVVGLPAQVAACARWKTLHTTKSSTGAHTCCVAKCAKPCAALASRRLCQGKQTF